MDINFDFTNLSVADARTALSFLLLGTNLDPYHFSYEKDSFGNTVMRCIKPSIIFEVTFFRSGEIEVSKYIAPGLSVMFSTQNYLQAYTYLSQQGYADKTIKIMHTQ